MRGVYVKIVLPRGSRSDTALSDPILRRLQEDDRFEVYPYELPCQNYPLACTLFRDFIQRLNPDLVLCVGDRVEMAAAAATAFSLNIAVAHVYAGVTQTPFTLDDVHRHAITLYAAVHFCESVHAATAVCKIRDACDLPAHGVHVVGITHFDDIDLENLDTFKVPTVPYDLVLYNATTNLDADRRTKFAARDILTILRLNKASGNQMVVIGPNPDDPDLDYRLLIKNALVHYPTLPRLQFLALLKYCTNFISNSSAVVYEAPVLMTATDQIIHPIGLRNAYRPRGPFELGASDKIVKILGEYVHAAQFRLEKKK